MTASQTAPTPSLRRLITYELRLVLSCLCRALADEPTARAVGLAVDGDSGFVAGAGRLAARHS